MQPQTEVQERKRGLDIDSVLKVFDIEPMDYKSAWKALKADIMEANAGKVPTLAAASLKLPEALRLFDLHEVETDLYADIQGLPIPKYFEENIARIYSVTSNGYTNNEAFSRTILDQILVFSMYEESNSSDEAKSEGPSDFVLAYPSAPDTSTQEDPAKLELLHEMPLSRLVSHEGETKMLSGIADYSVWYDSSKKKTLATNLLIIEAKRRNHTDVALPQLIAYMGIVSSTRKELKQNSVVYGVASDGRSFRFCRIDNNGDFVQSKLLEWKLGDKGKIYSIIRSLIRTVALSSPSTTPIKDPMRRKMVLASFGSPQRSHKFDYGLSKIKILEGDDDEVEFIKLKERA